MSESLAASSPSGNAVGPYTRIEAGTGNTRIKINGVVADAPIGSVRDPHLPVAFRPIRKTSRVPGSRWRTCA